MGYCSNYLLSRLLRLQKRAVRLLLDADFTQRSVTLFSKLKWLPIFDLIKLRKLVLLFIILNNPDAPFCLKLKFNFLSSFYFVQLGCAPELALLIFKLPTRGLILESAPLLTLLPPFSIVSTLILRKWLVYLLLLLLFSFRLNNFKQELLILFLNFASNVSHLEELMCYGCRFSFYCNCMRR